MATVWDWMKRCVNYGSADREQGIHSNGKTRSPHPEAPAATGKHFRLVSGNDWGHYRLDYIR